MGFDGSPSQVVPESDSTPDVKKNEVHHPSVSDQLKPSGTEHSPLAEESASTEHTKGSYPKVAYSTNVPANWQWQRYEDWRNYHTEANHRIEEAFQKGCSHVRIMSGKHMNTPMELFFGDMVQYDPITGNARNIRRLGQDTLMQKLRRIGYGLLEQMETGSVRHKSFLKYKKKMMKKPQNRIVGTNTRELSKLVKPPRSEYCRRVAQSGGFVFLQMTAILLNTMVIGLDVEYNVDSASESTKQIFAIVDHLFCAFFTGEIIIRFGAMNKTPNFATTCRKVWKDKWFVFDLVLVVPMVFETWGIAFFFWLAGAEASSSGVSSFTTLRLLRLMKLGRIGRVARVLKFFPEIFMMIKSIIAAMRAVLVTFGFLLFLLYIFAIIFKSRAANSDIEELFPNIFASMWQLLLNGAFMDNVGDTMEAIWESEQGLAAVFLLFIFLSNLTVLNMLIGVICEVANNVSTKEREMAAEKALSKDLKEFLECFDTNQDGLIGVKEFELLVGNPDVKLMLERHEVDVDVIVSLKDAIFMDKDAMREEHAKQHKQELEQDENAAVQSIDPVNAIWKALTFDNLIQIILRFRGGGGSHCTVLDLIELERNIYKRLDQLETVSVRSKLANAFASGLKKIPKGPSATLDEAPLPPPKDPDIPIVENIGKTPVKGGAAAVWRMSKGSMGESAPTSAGLLHSAGVPHSPEALNAVDFTLESPQNSLRKEMQQLVQQQADFCAEIREQIKVLAVGQREIASTQARLGQVVRDRVGPYNQASGSDADNGCPEQSHAAPENAAPISQHRPKPGTNATSADEWGDTQMHMGNFKKAIPKTAIVAEEQPEELS